MAEELASAPDYPVDEKTDKGFANWFRSLEPVRRWWTFQDIVYKYKVQVLKGNGFAEALFCAESCYYSLLRQEGMLTEAQALSQILKSIKLCFVRPQHMHSYLLLAGLLHLPWRGRTFYRQDILQDDRGRQVYWRPGEGPPW